MTSILISSNERKHYAYRKRIFVFYAYLDTYFDNPISWQNCYDYHQIHNIKIDHTFYYPCCKNIAELVMNQRQSPSVVCMDPLYINKSYKWSCIRFKQTVILPSHKTWQAGRDGKLLPLPQQPE